MTVREKLENLLYNRGMFESQAKEVIDIAIPELDKMSAEMGQSKVNWDRPSEDWPNVMYSVWIMAIEPISLKWIEKNCPMAWFKPMFMKEADREKFLNS